MEPKKIESMDDLRAAMKDPEIQAANKAFSKKYLKANRPKSLAVISLAIIAVFLLMTLSSHKASSVTPTALRTAEEVSWSLDGQAEAVLTAQQREDLISLLDEDGVESEYRIIACAELDGVEYMALEPIGKDPEEALMEAAQLVFLRLSEELDEDGEQYLESIQDEEEFDRVAEIFRDKLSEEYEFLEDDGEE